MPDSQRENDHSLAHDFAQNARPTPQGVADSLTILRKHPVPFAADVLGYRLDLLLLPLLDGIPTTTGRISRLQQALALAADQLERDHETAYRHVFLEPKHRRLADRRSAAFAEIPKDVGFRTRKTATTVIRIEEKMLVALANILLDPEFEQDVDTAHPKPAPSVRYERRLPAHAFEIVSYTAAMEIDDADHRKYKLHRKVKLNTLVPDQRVVGLRYFKESSDPHPVKGGVTTPTKGHTYLGTFPDTPEGSSGAWMAHLVHLGGRKRPGDEVEVELHEEFFDKEEADPHVFLNLTVPHEAMCEIHLGVRLPATKRSDVKPEARTTHDPHHTSQSKEKVPLPIEPDGWVRERFTNLETGVQYGIYFPGLDLYK